MAGSRIASRYPLKLRFSNLRRPKKTPEIKDIEISFQDINGRHRKTPESTKKTKTYTKTQKGWINAKGIRAGEEIQYRYSSSAKKSKFVEKQILDELTKCDPNKLKNLKQVGRYQSVMGLAWRGPVKLFFQSGKLAKIILKDNFKKKPTYIEIEFKNGEIISETKYVQNPTKAK